nr:TIM barrel protein [Pseudoduganella violaceinigra]
MVLHNLPAGDWTGGERGHPNRVAEFEQGVETALAYASVLGTQRINCLVGVKPQGVDDADARAVLVRNLKFAAVALKKAGIPLLVEPINTFDIPGFFLSGTRQGLELIECSERKRALCPFPHRARPC